jgi:hypothetical protein
MIKKIKILIEEYRKNVLFQNQKMQEIEQQLLELNWANVYHDTIRGKPWLEQLSHSPGNWAADYSLLYVLVRTLNDCRPQRILEFGLGETSKIISLFLQFDLLKSHHLILENNLQWKEYFESHFSLCDRSNIKIVPLKEKRMENKVYKGYEGIENLSDKFDFYLVDGPKGSEHFSRFDICSIASKLEKSDEFIIILDDCDRPGEMETSDQLVNLFAKKEIPVKIKQYYGKKNFNVFVTPQYSWMASL